MPRIPTPLTWKRRHFAVLEPAGMVEKFTSVAVAGIVAGPFAIYSCPQAGLSFTLLHLPSQTKILRLEMQNLCKNAAEEFAALDVNWWTCDPEEVIGPDFQALRNAYQKWLPPTSVGTGKVV